MEIPKRKFALEEKDLAIEADKNNKIAEEKENRFLKKIQEDATNSIKHLPTDKVLERLPDPTGWRIFPRLLITLYGFAFYRTTEWFMALPDPTNAQSAFVSVIVGAGAAWFGLYVGGTRQPKPESKEQLAKF